ncbi:invasion associated locus B family protein [Yoonia vestfoldensis]|uniref:Invasion associated locus B (IalB) protein n=1 Tax=Yoonia vestfoldensis TaxID=245188 RepID=A0A1Y0EAQ0_9RHOB|nr:invasion associated locus B family protein [Yoonia vestfoldensis]ARU00707.1 invasion associated locus B (IalB) protein [Yoonia vestfoldensis]
MRRTTTALTLAAFLAIGTQATAQDDTNALDLGEPVTPRIGEIYVADTHGDWEVRCIRAPEGQDDRCNLYQLLTNDADAPVAEFNLFRLPQGGQAMAGANIVVPLETLLTQQLTLSVDDGEPRRYPFSFCNAAGCVARIGLTEAEIAAFEAGSTATLRLVPAAAPEDDFLLTMSLAGFTEGFDNLAVIP